MIAMMLLFLIIDYFVQQRQASQLAASGVRQPIRNINLEDFLLPNGLFVAHNHLKGQLTSDGALKIGLDNFILNSMGKIDNILLPQNNSQVKKGDVLFTLVQGDQKTTVKAFANGTVTNLNPNYRLSNANTWAITFLPNQLSTTLRMLKIGQEAKEWIKSEINRFREFLNEETSAPSTALVLQDGGLPMFGVLQDLDAKVLQRFEKEFLS